MEVWWYYLFCYFSVMLDNQKEQSTSTIRKSVVERASDIGYKILDPDWFDRTNINVMTTPVTKEEFEQWFWKCTIQKIEPKVELTEQMVEDLIQELRPVFLKFWIDHEHFDRAFRKSEVFGLIMKQIHMEKQPKKVSDKKPVEYNAVTHMMLMRKHWMTLKDIGEIFGITWERVRQLLSNK